MTRITKRVGAVVLALGLGVAQPGIAQDLAARVASAPDGWVRFTYEAREGVCGNGSRISTRHEREDGSLGECECECQEAPVRIEMRVRDGEVRDLDADVGGTWQTRRGAVTDLGDVAPAAAVAFLFALAETAREEVAEDAIFPATIARGVETWPRLLEIARSEAHADVRGQAVFWLGREASERATEGLTSIIESEDELEIREHAIFALSQRDEERAFEALLGIARSSPEPELRRKAIFWLGQMGDDPRVLRLLEDILSGDR